MEPQKFIFLNTTCVMNICKLRSQKVLKHWHQMFSELLNPEDKAFLFTFPDLLLSLTEKSPDFLLKIYENPLVRYSYSRDWAIT